MYKSFSKIFVLVFALIVIGAGYVLFSPTSPEIIQPQEQILAPDARIPTTLVVEGQTYGMALNQSSSVYDMMESAREIHGLNFVAKEFEGLGFFIEQIEGKGGDASDGKYWIYYVNGEKANIGVSDYIVQAGDTIMWKYEQATGEE